MHGFYDTALTFVSRLAGRVEEYLDATFDELTEGTHRLFFALTLVMSFMVFAGGFYLTACMFVEAKKFRWAWPSPYAHAQRDPDKKEGSKALPHELAELNRQLAAQHQARTRRADRPDGGGPVTGLPPEGSRRL